MSERQIETFPNIYLNETALNHEHCGLRLQDGAAEVYTIE